MTTDLNTFDGLLAEVDKASDEIRRLKDALHLQTLRSSDDTSGLEAAIRYWEGRKLDLENKMRAFR